MSDQTVEVGTQIIFYVSSSFNPADDHSNLKIGTPTEATITLASLTNNDARQSDKVDLGANRAPSYSVMAAVDYTGETPVSTGRVDYYWAPSPSGETSEGNIAGISGADASAPNGGLANVTLSAFLKQCDFIGSLKIHDGSGVQVGKVGVLFPTERYGQLIVHNLGGDTFEADDVETHTVFNPIIPDQA